MLIGQLACLAGLPVSTLRYYERAGLLSRPPRSAAGYRTYSSRAIAEIALIRSAREFGFSLRAIRELLEVVKRGADPCDRLKSLAAKRLSLLNRELVSLRRQRDELNRAVRSWQRGCTFDPHAVNCGVAPGRSHAGTSRLKS